MTLLPFPAVTPSGLLDALMTDDALEAIDGLLRFARNELVKAEMPLSIAARDEAIAAILEPFTEDLAQHFLGLPDRAIAGVRKDLGWDADQLDWDQEDQQLDAILRRWLVGLGVAGFDEAMDSLGLQARLDIGVDVPRWISDRIGRAIKDIDLTTRRALEDLVTKAVERGYSIEQLVRGVPDAGFPGLRGLAETWSRSRATTIALTETATVWNTGSIEGYRASGLVDEVSVFDGVNDAPCAAANGATWPLDEALANPVAHPRCFPGGTPVVASGVSAAYSRWYEGDLVVIKTAAGHELAATPNHPVLTRRGWLPIGEVEHGDHLVRALDAERVIATADPDHDHVVARIAEVAHALGVVSTSMPATPEDFHGDVTDGDVYVVRTHRPLEDGGVPALGEPRSELALCGGDVAVQAPLALAGASFQVGRGHLGALDGSVGSGSDAVPLPFVGTVAQQLGVAIVTDQEPQALEAAAQLSSTDARLRSELTATLPGLVALMERPDGGLVHSGVAAAVVDDRDAAHPEVATERIAADPEGAADLIERLAGLVELDRVVDRRRVGWAGHVYNLETGPGWYVADGLIVHNCQRAFAAVVAR
jgi:hypothetical protein